MADELAQMYGIQEDPDELLRQSLGAAAPAPAEPSPKQRADEMRASRARAQHEARFGNPQARAAADVDRAFADEGIDTAPAARLAAAVDLYDQEQLAQERANIAGPPSQFDIAGAAGMRGAAADSEAAAIRQALMQGYNAPSAPNPLHPIREQYAGQMGQLLGEQDTNYQALHGAQQNEMQAHANAYAQEAGRQEAAIAVQEAKAQRDMERRNEALQKSQLVMSKVTQAADRLNESPDIDPNRYWASQSAGRKFGWGLSAALLGFAGLNPTGALQEAIARDIDAQKANFAQKQAGFGARMEEMGASRSVYQDLREAIGDEQATDMAMEHARLTQAETAFKAMAAKEGIPVAVAEQNVFLNEWRQRRAELERGLAEMMATTPERIGGGFRPAVSGFQRKVLEGALKDLDRRGEKMGELAITQGGAAAGDFTRAQTDLAKAEIEAGGKKAETKRQHSFEQRKWVAEKVEPYRNEAKLIEEFQAQYANEIPGISFGLPPTKITDDQKQAYERLKRIVMVRLRRESGAAISDKELENDAAAILNAMDEDDVRNMLNDRLNEARRRIDFYERAPDEEEVDQVNRAKAAPRSAISAGGTGLPSVVSWDD